MENFDLVLSVVTLFGHCVIALYATFLYGYTDCDKRAAWFYFVMATVAVVFGRLLGLLIKVHFFKTGMWSIGIDVVRLVNGLAITVLFMVFCYKCYDYFRSKKESGKQCANYRRIE